MSAAQGAHTPRSVPVLLLKTKSTPGDAYEELFSSAENGGGIAFEPRFLPVLQHRFDTQGLTRLGELLRDRRIGRDEESSYGGLIFTSQRAVEAFARVVDEGKGGQGWPHLQEVPIYSVGPATTRALGAIAQQPPLNIFGEHTGNGESLAQFILAHYGEWYESRARKPPLLFPVGKQRRDIIPRTLMDGKLPSSTRIQVDELVVYGTEVMESFNDDFRQHLQDTSERATRWVVIFSPTGCDVMLAGLGLLDETTGQARTTTKGPEARNTFVAAIGPTTTAYLQRSFGFEPDVSAAEPSPQGLRNGIVAFMERRNGTYLHGTESVPAA